MMRVLRKPSCGIGFVGALIVFGGTTRAADVAPAEPVVLTVAAAANLVDVIQPIDSAFLAHHAQGSIRTSIAASGTIYAQIKSGAPFDVFVSADVDFPSKLAAEGNALGDTLRPYAVGQLAVWTTSPAVDLIPGLRVVLDPSIHRVAIANVDSAPYGRAAKAALERAGLWAPVQTKLVIGENIAQTAQFVQTGNAEIGFVAFSSLKSLALAGTGHFWIVPADAYPPITQAAVVTQVGARNPLARSYVEFLGSPEAAAIFDRFGYAQPAPAPR